MFDEINNDEEALRKKFEELLAKGTLRSCPNLTNLPMEEKERISKQALADAMEMLMKTYLSLGLGGEAILGAEDGFSKTRYKLHFKVLAEGEEDEHFNRKGF